MSSKNYVNCQVFPFFLNLRKYILCDKCDYYECQSTDYGNPKVVKMFNE